MKFNFFFISYTVIYAKYNHCYEIPRDMPIRYFDGKEWKFMKTRHNVRTKALRYTNISTELDWADLIKEIKEIELQETTTQMPPTCGRTKTQTTGTKKTTTETITTKKTKTETTTTKKTTTRKKTTTKKITTKMTAPKTTLKNDRPFTKLFTPTKAAVRHSPPHCKSKLKTATTTTIDPRIWQIKMLTSEDWINAWTRVRPTKKLCPVGQGFLVDPSHYKLKLETITTTTIDPLIWQMKMNNNEDWINIWTRVRPTKKPPLTTKKYTTKNLPVTRPNKPATTTKAPVTKTKEPVTTAEKSVFKVSGIQGNDGNEPENWSNLMREFLKFVELKKCMQPPCEYGTTSTVPSTEYMFGDKRIRSGADDLTNFLMDGVEIDDRLDNRSEVEDDASLEQFKETYVANEGQTLNFDSVEGSASRDSKINNDNVQDLDLMSFKDSVEFRRIKQDEETAQYRKKNAFFKELKSKNVKQNYKTPRNSLSDGYEDELKVENAIGDDEVLQDSELNSYLDVFIDKHTKKENEPAKSRETKAYLDAKNTKHTGKRFDAIKDMYTQTNKDNSQYVSKDTLNFKELNQIADYVATKPTCSTYSTEMRNDNDDFLQGRDITFIDLGTLESDHEKADKYSTESIEFRESDVYAYADTVIDMNEQKDDKTYKSYENVIPSINFKYALNDSITK